MRATNLRMLTIAKPQNAQKQRVSPRAAVPNTLETGRLLGLAHWGSRGHEGAVMTDKFHAESFGSSDGRIWAWGTSNKGQLGIGSRESIRLPTALKSLINVRQGAAGYECALAVRDDDTVWAWGDNDYGKLGDGTEDEQPSPVQVSTLTGVAMVAAGARHTRSRAMARSRLGAGTSSMSSAPGPGAAGQPQ